MELLKGPVKKINREGDQILNEILKARNTFERNESKNE